VLLCSTSFETVATARRELRRIGRPWRTAVRARPVGHDGRPGNGDPVPRTPFTHYRRNPAVLGRDRDDLRRLRAVRGRRVRRGGGFDDGLPSAVGVRIFHLHRPIRPAPLAVDRGNPDHLMGTIEARRTPRSSMAFGHRSGPTPFQADRSGVQARRSPAHT